MSTSFATDVAPLFAPNDTRCMNAQGVQLTDFAYMSSAVGDGDFPDHANARHVLARVKGDEVPRMPPGAAPWGADKIATLQSWIDGGFLP